MTKSVPFNKPGEESTREARKAVGPDSISSSLIKSCVDQIVQRMFKLSLKHILPLPKNKHPKDLNSYRLGVLQSYLMKTLEKPCPWPCPWPPGEPISGPATVCNPHVEKAGSTVRIMFFDFSAAFNIIQHMRLKDKLECTGVDQHLTAWLKDSLTNRPWYVRIQDCECNMAVCSIAGCGLTTQMYYIRNGKTHCTC